MNKLKILKGEIAIMNRYMGDSDFNSLNNHLVNSLLQ